MTFEEHNARWYQTWEIEEFRTVARNLCRCIRVHGNELAQKLYDEDLCVRGLEQRISLRRQLERLLAVRVVVNAQYTKDPSELAMLAMNYTAFAKQEALMCGIRDHYAVYHPERVQLFPEIPEEPFQVTIESLKRNLVLNRKLDKNEHKLEKRHRISRLVQV